MNSMKAAPLLPPMLLALLLAPGASAEPGPGASFFGSSYMEVPLEEAYGEISLHLQFLTGKRAGLLFLAAGHSDYLLVEMQAGAIQVRLDLGSGEVRAHSPAGLKLDNLVTHDLELNVGSGKITLLIDSLFSTTTEIPGPWQELNIHHGLYVGGAGDLDLPYLTGVSTPFRGCLHATTFNGLDLFALLTSNTGSRTVHEIKDGCRQEFSAGLDDPFSFSGPQSFIAFPSWNARKEGSIEFRMTSTADHAPLIFQSGPQHDFVYLEILNGYLRGTVNSGSGVVKLQNNIYINDDQPHDIRIYIDAFKFEISVDNYVSRTSKTGVHNFLDLQGSLLVGGFDDDTFDILKESQLGYILRDESSYRSFVGCMEDLRINLEKKSLQDALVTKDILGGCENDDYEEEYEYYDAPTTPAPTSTPLIWQGLRALTTEPCQLESGLPAIFNNFTRLLNLSPLVVREGGTSFLELGHTQPTIDLAVVGIRQSQVLFSVTHDARYGYLELDIPGASTRKRFTLLDIIKRKVKYVHDGSEGTMDQLAFEVTINTKVAIPECLRKGQTYLFPISITPVNDPPQVVFPQGDIIVILEHTSKLLSSDIIHIVDPDTPCDNLKILRASEKSMEGGYLAYQYQPAQAIDHFSCNDLEDGVVAFVYQSGLAQQLNLQASDGISRGPIATLRIISREPDILVGNNTGLIISQGDAVSITPSNLSVETNAVEQKVDIFYRVVEPLRFGEVRKKGITGEWRVTESFQQHDIEEGQLKYFSTDAEHHKEDITERLRFEVQVGEKILPNNTFFIKVKRSPIQMVNMAPLELKKSRQQNITTRDMKASLEGQSPNASSYQYVILQAPRKGNLMLGGQRLTEGQNFTQEDLLEKRLSFQTTARNSKDTEDYFQFRIFVSSQYSPVYEYKIKIGADLHAPVLTNVLLSVIEGGEVLISSDHLFVKSSISMNYLYEVIEGPQHGRLLRRKSSRQPSNDEVLTEFTNEDILQGVLVYQHDGSETTEDDIPFVAIRQVEGSAESPFFDREIEEVRGVFRVSIQPVNDNAPVQVVNKVFNVVRGGQRLLTTSDIAFTDKDSGSTDLQLVLVRRGVPFGNIVFVEDTAHQVYRFTQEDLRKKRVLFVHSGADHGWFQLQVSDGLHQVTALVEVQASDPYIEIVNNTGLTVQQGGEKVLDDSVLRLETNVDIRTEDGISFKIIIPPQEGVIRKGVQQVSSFSQKDLLSGEIVYHHNGSSSTRDFFEFSAEANQVAVEDSVEIMVFLEGGNPPQVIHNEKMYVFQGEAAEIKKEYLMVSDENSFPHEIVYYVRSPPRLGVLVTTSLSDSSEGSLHNIQTFTQEDLNAGHILYLYSRPGLGADPFTLDVSNGAKVLEGLVVHMEVLPMTVPLKVQNITVQEGGSRVLSTEVLQIPSSYFTNLNLEFTVVEPPRHGTIRNAERHGDESLFYFTWNEVEQQLILYEHDDTETESDAFTLAANASEIGRQSHPVTIVVDIRPVNDESPILTVNAGLQIWEGATADITASLLSSTDKDSPPEEVVYSIQPPASGKVLQRSPSGNKDIVEFTQAQVDQGLIFYQHQGSLDGGFAFDISDGDNVSPGHFFTVTAKSLVITMEAKQDLTVCPGANQPITSQILRAASNTDEQPSSPLVYSVVEPPRQGRLVSTRQLSSDSVGLMNFTQSEVDAGEIFYHHEMPSVPFWISHDAFRFRVSSSRAVTELQTLEASISFEGSCPLLPSRLWVNNGLTIAESRSATINRSSLDATNLLASLTESNRSSYDVMFLLRGFPTHGQLSVSSRPIGEHRPYFLQSDLQSGSLEYVHNGSGAEMDSFQFTAWVWATDHSFSGPPQDEGTIVISESFNITVMDVNEHSPQLLTQTPSLQTRQGSAVTLTTDHLNVIDLDSTPDEIEYTILEGPTNGFLAHADNRAVPILQFTQEDISKGRLMFIVTGSRVSDAFNLSISDGYHIPILTSLEVQVLPAILSVTNKKPVEMRQDQNQTTLTQDHLLAISDGEEQNIIYRITRAPEFGQLMVNHQEVQEFSQIQVDKGELSFAFKDLSSSRDEFSFVATSGGANAPGVVSISVKPVVRIQRGIVLPRGTTVLIDTDILDASELANKTNSVPTFKVLRAPKSSLFVKVLESGETQPMSADIFTQRELEQGLIGLEVLQELRDGVPLQSDSFQLELAAKGVPPATATVKFTTRMYDPAVTYHAKLLQFPRAPEASTRLYVEPFVMTIAPWNQVSEDSLMANSTEASISTTIQQSKSPTNTVPMQRTSFLSFIEANMFTIILPVCLIILLSALGLLLLYYLIRRNKTGKHHVQGTSFKPSNGTTDHETFRKTDPNQAIPLSTMKPLESKGQESSASRPMETGGQADPELLQSCRTSNPALKNSQYWV
ncbi:chondroitin sulfate proteoglycan 4 [Ambystoma mexicanum]|uniref:chondroitin sulfate proteoglycan 4 n=1 Tax=Ambystoma mexicanum TaxID=8296 RepID=UPI0037E97256